MNRLMLDKNPGVVFYGITLLFIAAGIFMLSKGNYWFSVLPLALVIIYLAVYSLDKILLIIAFCTPLGITLNDKDAGPALSIPGEPLLFGVMLLVVFKIFAEKNFDKKILTHPVTLAIGFHLAWMFITSVTSTFPLVSFKYFISQLWFIIPFYLLGTQLFRKIINIKRFVWLYSATLFIVIVYTLVQHADNNWTQMAAHWVMYPFYNDHTAYAAVLAMFIPPMIAFMRERDASVRERFGSMFMLGVLVTALILSYTRAAWLSIIVAAIIYLIYVFRIKFYIVFMGMVAVFTVFMIFRTDIFISMERNRQDSATDINKHIQSISNISTDASNLERLNRWSSALRMFEEKPITGWGPGTYQFNYAPYQKSSEMTIISTYAGDAGNAHSEYIGPMAESGILGLVGFLLIVITVIYRSSILYATARDKKVKLLAMGILIGLMTYLIHANLNNFLNTDKLAVPFWAFVAMLVALDVYHKDKLLKPAA